LTISAINLEAGYRYAVPPNCQKAQKNLTPCFFQKKGVASLRDNTQN